MVSGSQAGPSMGKGVYIRRVPDGAAPGPMCKESRRLKRVYVRFVSTLRIKCQRRASPGVGSLRPDKLPLRQQVCNTE